jgi:hypothetical protein
MHWLLCCIALLTKPDIVVTVVEATGADEATDNVEAARVGEATVIVEAPGTAEAANVDAV